MPRRSPDQPSFVSDGRFPAAPGGVSPAWSTAGARAAWFVGPAGKWSVLERKLDFRVGGRERVRGAIAGGPVTDFDACYFDIVPNERIVYAYGMHLDDRRISVSLATIEFKPQGTGTRLVLTEQGVFLDGYDDAGSREPGTRGLLDQLEAALRQAA